MEETGTPSPGHDSGVRDACLPPEKAEEDKDSGRGREELRMGEAAISGSLLLGKPAGQGAGWTVETSSSLACLGNTTETEADKDKAHLPSAAFQHAPRGLQAGVGMETVLETLVTRSDFMSRAAAVAQLQRGEVGQWEDGGSEPRCSGDALLRFMEGTPAPRLPACPSHP